jgi:uncharacterized repeat protein (TIGR01451 family)
MNLQHLGRVLAIAAVLLGITLFSLLHIQQASQAQDVMLTKRLNKSSPVVRVGELISFTITLHNNANFTLTNVTMIDNYAAEVMAFAGALPVLPDVHTPTVGGLQWNNVAVPPIPVGQTITFTVFFTVEHPETNPVVNVVRAQDIRGSQDAISDTEAIDQIDEATGGNAPVVKFISPPDSTPQVGQPVTFTQVITNDGLAILTFLPLTDTYDPNFLEFNFAVPPPTISSPGQLVWTDLTDVFGDLAPLQTVVVTTVFTATAQAGNTINQASTEGARDEFDNDLAGGQASAGITIIGSAPTPTPRNDDDDDDNDNEILATPSTVVTVTPETVIVTVTPDISVTVETAMSGQDVLTGAQGPRYLPETGSLGNRPLGWLFVGMLLFLSLAIFKLRRR